MVHKRKRSDIPRFSLREKLNKRKLKDEDNFFWNYGEEEEEQEAYENTWGIFPLSNLLLMHKYLWEKTLSIIVFLIIVYIISFLNFSQAQNIQGSIYQVTVQHLDVNAYSNKMASFFQEYVFLKPFTSQVDLKGPEDEGKEVKETSVSDLTFVLPVEGSVAGRYGLREDPFTGVSRMCYGIDIITSPKALVSASAPGTVKKINTHSIYNLTVEIKHEGGISCIYGNLGEVTVEKEDRVEPGHVIANMKEEENPVLYFQVRKEGRPVDPLKFISGID